MSNKKNIKIIIKTIEETLGLKKGSINEKSKSVNYENWDSLGIINIITALEHELEIKFKIDDYEKFNSVNEINKILKDHKIK
tara:strand:+ start:53 stop:298 length:246 start_codon:yes stop_codon:yes gene_type:complete